MENGKFLFEIRSVWYDDANAERAHRKEQPGVIIGGRRLRATVLYWIEYMRTRATTESVIMMRDSQERRNASRMLRASVCVPRIKWVMKMGIDIERLDGARR